MRIATHTLGCKLNFAETSYLQEMFAKEGFTIVDFKGEADLYVINTCTVTSVAEKKCRTAIRQALSQNPSATVAVIGCYAQNAAEQIAAIPGVSIVLGNDRKHELLGIVKNLFAARDKSEAKECVPMNDTGEPKSFVPCFSGDDRTRVFFKVQDGCDSFCTYCIIPFARGRVASRSPESCIKEARYLAQNGFKEIIVSGIHLCSYGKDRGEDIMSLAKLLKQIDDTEGLERLRLGSLEPISMTDEFIDALAGLKHICPSFHLSLQSGSDSVLKRMNRHYDSKGYASRVKRLRERFPDMSLTTDIIVGFPGETDEEFEETMSFAKEMGFARIHVFPYSLREGTKAASMEQVAHEVKKQRESRLLALASDLSAEFAKAMTGRNEDVLVEKVSGLTASGYTRNYVRAEVLFDAGNGVPVPGDVIRGVVTGSKGAEIVLKNGL